MGTNQDFPFSYDSGFSGLDDLGHLKATLQVFANQLETLHRENRELREENQSLRDEINRLKGEKGKPDIKPSKPKGGKTAGLENGSGIKGKGKGEKKPKSETVKVDESVRIKFEGELPPDAVSKGCRIVVVQNTSIVTHNVEYVLERHYSPATSKTYEASLPDGIQPGYHGNLRAWVLYWHFKCRMSKTLIHQMLTGIGTVISEGQISNMVIKGHEGFHREKSEIVCAGIESSLPVHIDDTGARVNGDNQYCTVLCNEYFSAFFTEARKNRLSVIKILSQAEPEGPCFLLDGEALDFLKEQLPRKLTKSLGSLKEMTAGLPRDDFERLISESIPEISPLHMDTILEVAALTHYRQDENSPKVSCLVCDDAKQFYSITPLRALCWIHEERHYLKLAPYMEHHQKLLLAFRGRIWEFYKDLKIYSEQPDKAEKGRLSRLFYEIFATKTGYDDLDRRIALTKGKKENLLVVLDHPATPLHNNPAELAIRQYVIKRKISFGTRSDERTKSWETFFTIMDTCRKLQVDFRQYLTDRITGKGEMPSLASLIPSPSILKG